MESIISQIFKQVSGKYIEELVKRSIIDNDKVDDAKAVWDVCVKSLASVDVHFSETESTSFGEKTKQKPAVAPEKKSVENVDEGTCVYMPTRGKYQGVLCGKKTSGGKKMCSTHKKYEPSDTASEDEAVAAEKRPTQTEKKTCAHIITKGKESGRTCGANVKDGSDFCGRHLKNGTKKVVDEEKKDEEKTDEKIVVSFDKKTGRWTHKASGFVFKSKDERVVNGKVVNGQVVDITENDVKEIKKLKFKYELPVRAILKIQDVENIVKELLDDNVGEELDNEEGDEEDNEEGGEEEEELLEDDE